MSIFALSFGARHYRTEQQPSSLSPSCLRILLSLGALACDSVLLLGTGLYVCPYGEGLLTTAVVGLCIVMFYTLGAYRFGALRKPLRPCAMMMCVWASVLGAAYSLNIGGSWLQSWFVWGLGALALSRFGAAEMTRYLTSRGRLDKHVVIVGGWAHIAEITQSFQDEPVRVLGRFDDRGEARSPRFTGGVSKLGKIEDLVPYARKTRVDMAVFDLPATAQGRIGEIAERLKVLPLDAQLLESATTMREVLRKPLSERDVVLKAIVDRVLGLIALVLLSPVMMLTAVAIKLDSKGSVLFKQQRYGFNNELIEVYKFRSLYDDRCGVERLVGRNDPRVTRVGRWIRKMSLDELPQLFNVVFKGDMSLVGPRPHAVFAKAGNKRYEEAVGEYFSRHRVKPGMTGWAQIHGWRGETDTFEKLQARVEHDIHYINHWSLMLDLYILVRTPLSLLNVKNAY